MVDYIGVADIERLVHAQGVAPFIERLAGEIEADYARWPDFEKSARMASHSVDGVIELMPTSDGRFFSFKYVNGHPKNTAAGLLTVTAFGVLADVDTGYPLLLSELTVTTALRTAAPVRRSTWCPSSTIRRTCSAAPWAAVAPAFGAWPDETRAQRPRRNRASSSFSVTCRQVGRPWLHWSLRSVASMSRSRAFISPSVRRRLARTAAWQAIVDNSSSRARSTTRLASCCASSASTERASATGSASASAAGRERTASVEIGRAHV